MALRKPKKQTQSKPIQSQFKPNIGSVIHQFFKFRKGFELLGEILKYNAFEGILY